MPSIRRRIVILLLTGMAVLFAGAGFWLDRSLGGRLLEEFDTALLAQARLVQADVEQAGGRVEFELDQGTMPEFRCPENPAYFELWLADGEVVARAPSLGSHDLPYRSTVGTPPGFEDLRLPDGRHGRMVEFRFTPPPADEEVPVTGTTTPSRDVFLAVARGRGRLDRLIATMRSFLALGGAALMVLCALLVWAVLAAGLVPLRRMAAELGTLDEEKLQARIVIPSLPRELAPVVRQINDLLRRLEEAFERERRFNANVAHELRTPLAELRALAEVGGRWPDDPEVRERFFSDVRAISLRMERMVGDLLLLAHCQAGRETLRRAPVVLAALIRTCWSRLDAEAASRRTKLKLEIPVDARIETDVDKLGLLLTNLLSNAVSHAPQGSEVICQGAIDGGRFRLEVANPAGDLGTADLPRLREPFWRKSESRTGDEHLGIGLTLATALADLLEIDLRLDLDSAGWFHATVSGRAGRSGRAR